MPEDPGSLQVKATITYETRDGELSDTVEDWLDISRPGTVQPEVREEIKVTKTKSKVSFDYRNEVQDWRKPSGLTGDDSILLEFFEKRWECYSSYPNNKSQLDYLHNNHEKFQIESYFEIPTDPSTVLNEWALPDNLRGNVFLDEQRNSHVRQILAAPLEDNFVIIGEPGVGKTVLIQDSEEPKDNQRIDEDGMIERTYFSKELMTGYEMSFSEAFRNARKLKGPGKIFVWNGKHYTTDYYYELVLSVGEQVTEINYDEKTYKTEERLSETIAVRSYKDSDKKLITYKYLDNL